MERAACCGKNEKLLVIIVIMRIDHFLKVLANGRVTVRFGVVSFAQSVWFRSAWTSQWLSSSSYGRASKNQMESDAGYDGIKPPLGIVTQNRQTSLPTRCPMYEAR